MMRFEDALTAYQVKTDESEKWKSCFKESEDNLVTAREQIMKAREEYVALQKAGIKEQADKENQTEVGEEFFNERPTLIQRIEDLEAANGVLQTSNDALAREKDESQAKVAALEEEIVELKNRPVEKQIV